MTALNTNTSEKATSKPTHTLRKKVGYGNRTNFETIGVAWSRDDGSLYIKLHGTQIIDGGFYAFPNKEKTTEEGGQ